MGKKLLTYYSCSTVQDMAEFRVQMLYDFCILKQPAKGKPDPREDRVREFLLARGTESAMQAAIIDVLTERKTLEQMLKGGVRA